jgi:hypothetical protein
LQLVTTELAQSLARSFDVVVEATLSAGWGLRCGCGTVVLKSTFHGQIAFNPAPIVVDEITAVISPAGRFEVALALWQGPSILLVWCSTLPLHQGLRAFDGGSQQS